MNLLLYVVILILIVLVESIKMYAIKMSDAFQLLLLKEIVHPFAKQIWKVIAFVVRLLKCIAIPLMLAKT